MCMCVARHTQWLNRLDNPAKTYASSYLPLKVEVVRENNSTNALPPDSIHALHTMNVCVYVCMRECNILVPLCCCPILVQEY